MKKKRKINGDKEMIRQLLIEVDHSNRIKRKEAKGFVTPFRVAFFCVLFQMIEEVKGPFPDCPTRDSIISALAIFGDSTPKEIKAFLKGQDSLNEKFWREKINALLEEYENLINSGKARFNFDSKAITILRYEFFSTMRQLPVLKSFSKRHDFAALFETFANNETKKNLMMLHQSSYLFWYGVTYADDIKPTKKSQRKARRIVRDLEEKPKKTVREVTERILSSNPPVATSQNLSLSQEEIELLKSHHAECYSSITLFSPMTTIHHVAFRLGQDPNDLIAKLAGGELTVFLAVEEAKKRDI